MGLLEETKSFFQVKNIEPFEAGNTLAPMQSDPNVVELRTFEQLSHDHKDVLNKLALNRQDMIELERLRRQKIKELDEEREHLLLVQGSIEDQIAERFKKIFPHAEVVHKEPPPPDTDVVFPQPPTLPKVDRE